MKAIDAVNVPRPMNNMKTPAITRSFGNKTYEVYVHFSQTSKETMTDKIMRLIRNEINFADFS